MAGVVLRDTNAVLNSVWGGQRENKVTPHRGHYQVYGPETIILLKELKWVWNSARKTVMGWNVECVVILFVFNERWLFFLCRKAKMRKVPHRRRECEECGPRSEICARVYIVLHLRNGSRGGPIP